MLARLVMLSLIGALPFAVAALVHGMAWRRAARLRPRLEATCPDHAGDPLTVAAWARAVFADAVLSVTLPPLGLLRVPDPAGDPDRTPVLIAASAWCGGIARPLARFLREAGWPVAIVTLDTLTSRSLTRLQDAGAALARRCGASAVDLVALGAAGLVARIHASTPQAGIRRLTTIATPHHGTLAAWPLGGARIHPEGALVREAATIGAGNSDVSCVTIYSADDPALLPASNAYLHGAMAIEVRGLGHLGSFVAPQVLTLVVESLVDDFASAVSCAS